MKKILIAVLALAMFASAVPAKADNSEEIAIGIIGGVVGGLILGEILDGPRYPAYAVPPPPPGIYEESEVTEIPMQCQIKRVKVWSRVYNEYLIVKKRVCY